MSFATFYLATDTKMIISSLFKIINFSHCHQNCKRSFFLNNKIVKDHVIK